MPPERSTRSVQLSDEVVTALERASRVPWPDEACGLLVGRRIEGGFRVEAARSSPNRVERGSAGRRFEIDPAAIVLAEDEARRVGAELVGTWHSHPSGRAHPSALDRGAIWSDLALLIVAFEPGAPVELRAWRRDGDAFIELALQSGEARLTAADPRQAASRREPPSGFARVRS